MEPGLSVHDLQKIFDRYQIINGIDNCHHFTPDIRSDSISMRILETKEQNVAR